MIDNGIVKKIKKLIKLASGNKNQHERERALEAAANLAAKHNLDLASVRVTEEEFENKKGRRLDAWAYPLADAIEKLFFVRVLLMSERVRRRRVNSASIVGRSENIAVACEMLSFFIKSIEEEARSKTGDPVARKSFKSGAAYGVRQKSKEVIERERLKQVRDLDQESTALVLLRDSERQKISKFVEATIAPDGAVDSEPLVGNMSAFRAGVAYGFSLPVEPLTTKRIGA